MKSIKQWLIRVAFDWLYVIKKSYFMLHVRNLVVCFVLQKKSFMKLKTVRAVTYV